MKGSVFGPILFLIYINDLHNAIKFSTVHHFADDTNLLVSNSCIKKIQDQINLDLKYLCKWLKANKISSNASKTKVLIFRHQNKPINMYRKKPEDKLSMWNITIKIDGKKIEPSSHVKYLGILIDSFLNWNFRIDELTGLPQVLESPGIVLEFFLQEPCRDVSPDICFHLLTDLYYHNSMSCV